MKTENRQQMLVIIAGLGLLLLVGDSLVYQPLSKAWKARSQRIVELEKNVRDGKAMADRKTAVESKWRSMSTNTLSSDESIAGQQMLTAFERWRQDSRINVTGYRQNVRRPSDDSYSTLECRVDASGSLATITRFLYNVEKDPLAVRVEAVELAAHDASGGQFTLGLTVTGLVLPTQEK